MVFLLGFSQEVIGRMRPDFFTLLGLSLIGTQKENPEGEPRRRTQKDRQ
jgi:hypothetical protein